MKNLFDYATKELSQDAFLRWLFENYKDDNIGYISKELLAEFVNLNNEHKIKPEQISDIKTFGQAKDIDIVVDFKVDGRDYILAIEDKTTSHHHDDQLKRYKETIEKWNKQKKDIKRPTILIYYKSHRMEGWEEKVVHDAGWTNFSFERINAFWERYTSCENMIVEQYAMHIVKSYENASNTSLPNDLDIDKWIGYFECFKKQIDIDCDMEVSEYQSRYAYLKVRPRDAEKNITPYLEIRSRDCLDKDHKITINARILLYGVTLSKEDINNFKNRIEEPFHRENYKQQVASLLKRNEGPKVLSSKKQYEDTLKDTIEKYLSIFEHK